MLLGFKAQFPPKIEAGEKDHTLRADPGRRWKAGMKIHFATGIRTPRYKCFKEGICTGVQSIKIDWTNRTTPALPRVFVEGIERHSTFLYLLAIRDGFATTQDFLTWFAEDFEGVIIHWGKPYSKFCMIAQ